MCRKPGGRLYVSSWWSEVRPSTADLSESSGMKWPANKFGPGMKVETTNDFNHPVDDYAYELTIATNDWLPHG